MGKVIETRRPGACATCAAEVPIGTRVDWDRASTTLRCLDCVEAPEVAPVVEALPEPGVAGASAQRQYEQRKLRREERIRSKWGRLGGVVVALSDEPTHQRNWARGAEGERRLAQRLEHRIAGKDVVLLHDRRMPGSRGNIDHLAVGPSGVFVIDAKMNKGKVEVRRSGGLLRERQEQLVIGGRDQTKLVHGVTKQVEAVRGFAEGQPVIGILCFLEAELPLLIGLPPVNGVELRYLRGTAKRCSAEGPMSGLQVRELAQRLAIALPPAA